MKIWELWRKILNDDQDTQETEFLPAILEVTETPPSPIGRLILWTLVLLLVVALLWAIIGKIDEVAVATGKIIPVGQVKLVQSEDKAIVKKIYVKEGDYVKAGQLLVEMDPTNTGADLDRLKKQAAYYQLDIDRLMAEMNGTPFVPVLTADLNQKDVVSQQELYQSRLAQFQAQKAEATMKIAQNAAAVQSVEAQRLKYEKMLVIAQDKEKRLKRLVDQESVAMFDYLDQKSMRVNYETTLDALQEELLKAKAELTESERKLANTIATYKKDVMTEMVEARKQLYSYQEELKKATEKKRLSRLLAPCNGRINQLSVHTVGGIVTEAQALMMVVPDNVLMEIEAWVDNKDIGFIKVGQKAEVKVETFNFQKYGVVDATVTEISPDAIDSKPDDETNKKYRIGLKMAKKTILVNRKEVALSPGMAVTVEIKIKQKRIIDFFLDPFRRYQSEALRER